MRAGLSAAVMVLVAACSLVDGKADEGAKKLVEPKIETVLDWIPPDAESLIVANGPVEIREEEGFAAIGKLRQLEDAMQRMACGDLLDIGAGQFRKILRGRVIAVAASSARKFRTPKQLGAAPYEGCNCLILRRDLGEHALILKEALQRSAKAQEKIAGIAVYQFEEKREQDLWKFFVAIPRPNVLVCATDRGYLIELLNRMDSPKALRPRAFPEELPLWKQVDVKARFWALHHYRNQGKTLTGSFETEDPGAIGQVFVYQPTKDEKKPTARVTYVSKSASDLSGMVTRHWTGAGPIGQVMVKQLAAGTFQMTVAPGEEQNENLFLFLLLAHLGHVIAL